MKNPSLSMHPPCAHTLPLPETESGVVRNKNENSKTHVFSAPDPFQNRCSGSPGSASLFPSGTINRQGGIASGFNLIHQNPVKNFSGHFHPQPVLIQELIINRSSKDLFCLLKYIFMIFQNIIPCPLFITNIRVAGFRNYKPIIIAFLDIKPEPQDSKENLSLCD